MIENSEQPNNQSGGVTVSNRLFNLLMLGGLLVFVGIIVLIVAAVLSSGGSANVGGVVFIGPIPIVFGVGPDAGWLMIISLIIAVVTFVLLLFYMRRARR